MGGDWGSPDQAKTEAPLLPAFGTAVVPQEPLILNLSPIHKLLAARGAERGGGHFTEVGTIAQAHPHILILGCHFQLLSDMGFRRHFSSLGSLPV